MHPALVVLIVNIALVIIVALVMVVNIAIVIIVTLVIIVASVIIVLKDVVKKLLFTHIKFMRNLSTIPLQENIMLIMINGVFCAAV